MAIAKSSMKKSRNLLFLFFAIFLWHTSLLFSQPKYALNDLNSVLKSTKPDTASCQFLIDIENNNKNVSSDSALIILNKVQELAIAGETNTHNILFTFYEAKALLAIGEIQNKKLGEYDAAFTNFSKSYLLFEDVINKSLDVDAIRKSKLGEARSLCAIGEIYLAKGQNDKAFNHFKSSLKISHELLDKEGIATCLNNIGLIKKYLGNDILAKDFFLNSLSLRSELNNKQGIIECLNNLSDLYQQQKNYTEAIQYIEMGLKINEELQDKKALAIDYKNIANLHLQAIADSKNINTKDKNTHLNQAVEYAEKSYQLAKEINFLPLVSLSCSTLQKAWAIIGDPANSKKYKEIYVATKDSIHKNNHAQIVAEANIDNQSEANQKENSSPKNIIWIAIGSIILLVLLAFIIFREKF